MRSVLYLETSYLLPRLKSLGVQMCLPQVSVTSLLPPAAICDTANALLPMSSILVRRYIVKGRVQGVGFRWYVLREASLLTLRGWVRNTGDGHVEVLAAGPQEQHDALYAILQRGSRGSRVDTIERLDEPGIDATTLATFQIEGAW